MNNWIYNRGETWVVVFRQHECGQALMPGKVTLLGADQLHFYGFRCPLHGEVRPAYRFAQRNELGGTQIQVAAFDAEPQ
jgi:hypothetical protein